MDGWLAKYLDYTRVLESPRLFHLWSAIAVVGHVLGRKVWVNRQGRFYNYPGQLMVVLVSRSAAMRKGTATDQAVAMMARCPEWTVNVLPIRTSPQHVFRCLERKNDDGDYILDPEGHRVDSVGFIYAEELGAWLSKESWMVGMIANLTRLNNAPEGEERLAFQQWKAVLVNPCIGMLGGTTPKGVNDEIPESAIKTGFFGRVIWVFVESPEIERANALVGKVVREDLAAKEALQTELADRIAMLSGPMKLTKQGREWFESWYLTTHFPRLARMHVDVHAESGFVGRKDDHLLRVAMVLSASAGDSRLLTEGILKEALQLVEEVEQRMPLALREVGTSNTNHIDQRILATLEKAKVKEGWVWDTRLKSTLRRYYGTVDRFNAAMMTLEEAEEVERMRDGRDRVWWRRRWKAGRLVQLTQEMKTVGTEEDGDEE